MCQIPAIFLPFVEQSASFLSVFSAGEPYITEKAAPIEALDAVTESSLFVVCPSQLPRACISLSQFDGFHIPSITKGNVFEPNVQKGAGCKCIVMLF